MFELLKKLFDNVVNLLHHIKCNLSCCSSVVNVRVVEFSRETTPETASTKSNISRITTPFSRDTSPNVDGHDIPFIRGSTT